MNFQDGSAFVKIITVTQPSWSAFIEFGVCISRTGRGITLEMILICMQFAPASAEVTESVVWNRLFDLIGVDLQQMQNDLKAAQCIQTHIWRFLHQRLRLSEAAPLRRPALFCTVPFSTYGGQSILPSGEGKNVILLKKLMHSQTCEVHEVWTCACVRERKWDRDRAVSAGAGDSELGFVTLFNPAELWKKKHQLSQNTASRT